MSWNFSIHDADPARLCARAQEELTRHVGDDPVERTRRHNIACAIAAAVMPFRVPPGHALHLDTYGHIGPGSHDNVHIALDTRPIPPGDNV